MVILKLNKYKEVANRDRFVLPIENDIKLFTDIIDSSINFFLLKYISKYVFYTLYTTFLK